MAVAQVRFCRIQIDSLGQFPAGCLAQQVDAVVDRVGAQSALNNEDQRKRDFLDFSMKKQNSSDDRRDQRQQNLFNQQNQTQTNRDDTLHARDLNRRLFDLKKLKYKMDSDFKAESLSPNEYKRNIQDIQDQTDSVQNELQGLKTPFLGKRPAVTPPDTANDSIGPDDGSDQVQPGTQPPPQQAPQPKQQAPAPTQQALAAPQAGQPDQSGYVPGQVYKSKKTGQSKTYKGNGQWE